MAICECGATVAEGCQCSMTGSDCFTITGAGSADNPFAVEATLDPDATNLLECNPSGLGAFLPAEIADPPAVSVYHAIAQTIASGVSTILAYNQEEYDTDSMHDLVTNNSRITFNTAGVYVVTSQVRWEGNATGDRRIWIRRSGATTLASSEASADQSDEFDMNVTTRPIKYTAGQYVETLVAQNSGVSLQVLQDGDVSPYFGAVRVAVG